MHTGKINLFITEANGGFSGKENPISNAVKKAEEYAFPKLKIDWDIDVLLRSAKQQFSDTKDRVSGHTYENNLIRLIIEDGFDEFEISEVLVHELCHAARWGKNNEWMNTLFDVLIFEGLAVCFTEKFTKNRPKQQFYMQTILNRSDEENIKILDTLKDHLQDTNYDYEYVFAGHNDNLPHWAGYSLGYYLVNKYLEKSNKTIEAAFADKYKDIESTL